MTPIAARLLSELRARAGRGVRVLPAAYRDAFAVVCPTLSGEEFRDRLATLCEELESESQISLPRTQRLYDRAGAAKLPAWIDVLRDLPTAEPVPIDPTTFPWAPELRFGCEIQDARQLEILLCVQNFLSNGGRTRPMVPAKERSLELFGEEKRLERLRSGTLFGADRISLELLRCFVVLPPLVFEAERSTLAPRPILILENYSTYHSFARWNKEAQVYGAVFYGHGDSFETAAAGLAEVTRSINWDRRAFYFGDLDVRGVLIPIAASETLQAAQLARLLPHVGCYQRILARARGTQLPAGEPTELSRPCREWLGEDLSKQTDAWLASGKRIPQELVGWEELSRAGQTFALPTTR